MQTFLCPALPTVSKAKKYAIFLRARTMLPMPSKEEVVVSYLWFRLQIRGLSYEPRNHSIRFIVHYSNP